MKVWVESDKTAAAALVAFVVTAALGSQRFGDTAIVARRVSAAL